MSGVGRNQERMDRVVTSEDQIKDISDFIVLKIRDILNSNIWKQWNQDVQKKGGKYIAKKNYCMLDSSLFLREDHTTTRSNKHLLFSHFDMNALPLESDFHVYIVSTKTSDTNKPNPYKDIKTQFQYINQNLNSQNSEFITNIEDEVKEEVEQLGIIIFSLVGEINISNDNNLYDINYKKIVKDCHSILGEIVNRIEKQIKEYDELLLKAFNLNSSQLKSSEDQNDIKDPSAYTDLLRIAYNFADGSKTLLNLLIGICDLKPILFWMTIYEQIKLVNKLSLSLSHTATKKPKLSEYKSFIGKARNQAFHDFFAFNSSFSMKLPEGSIKSPVLNLFPEFGSKKELPTLDFTDEKLIDLFKKFSRTAEGFVPSGFWEDNREIMELIKTFTSSMLEALLKLAPLVVGINPIND